MAVIADKFGKASIDTDYAIATTVKTTRVSGATVLEAFDLSKFSDDTPVFFVTYKKTTDPVTDITSVTNLISWKGLVNTGANTITNLTLAPGYADTGNAIGDFIECIPTSYWSNSLIEGILTSLNPNGTIKNAALNLAAAVPDTTSLVNPTGSILNHAGRFAPSGWLMCNGAAVSRTTYAALFESINPVVGTVVVTIATPGNVNYTAHGLKTGEAVHLTTTGTLPTGLSSAAQYFVIYVDANNFRLATTYGNALAGTAINTSGSQSGVHTLRFAPYGVGDGSTTFNIPDLRGRVIAGTDNMGGTSADRLTGYRQGVNGDIIGQAGGEQSHAQTWGEIAAHTHTQAGMALNGGGGYSHVAGNGSWNFASLTANNGQDTYSAGYTEAFNVVQPTLVMNSIIKT